MSKYIRGTLNGCIVPNSSSLTGCIVPNSSSLTGNITTTSGKQIKVIHSDITANWNAQQGLIGKKDHLYVYTDYILDGTNAYPGFKVGDGETLLIATPFAVAKWGDIQGDIRDQQDLYNLIGNVNIDDLHQDEGTYLILDCGTSIRVMEDPS